MSLHDSVPDAVREKIYDAVEDCINRSVTLADLLRVIVQAWPEIHQEKANHARKEAEHLMHKYQQAS